MKKYLTVTALGVVGAWAQVQHHVEIRREGTFTSALPGGPGDVVKFISEEFAFEASTVKGAPYAADAVTETTQRLADGNQIRRKSTAQVFRDGEGRTRREQSLEAVGPWASGAAHKMIMINDPVSGVHYSLSPDTRTAIKMPAMGNARFDIKIGDEGAPGFAANHNMIYSLHGDPAADLHAIRKKAVALGQQPRTEQLGKRLIEGVEAEGTRTTMTIAAGAMGNDLPIETVSERWFSNDLKTVIMTRRNDPRTGETTYRLTGIRRGEPGRHLFEVPSDYTLKEPQVRQRVEQK